MTQFGYEQLGVARSVIVPETGAVQDDYIMGSGDEVVVSLRGQENSDIRTSVDRAGRVVLPRLSPISATGRTFGSFREDLDAAVRRAYVASTASTSIGRVRQISVLVSGEVNNPGLRLVTGLSSVVDALLLSGGVKKGGSLRNVRIQRKGQDNVVDLYSLLTGGGSPGGMRLADGDRIIVPPLGPTVAITGLVRRPGIYELPARGRSITVRALLSLAGGQEVRGRYRLAAQRIEADGRLNLVSLQGENDVIRDSEILRVELGADLASSQATLSGGVGLAGQFAVSSSAKLSDVVRAPGALGQTPYTLFGLIVRKDSRTLLRTLMAFTPVAVLSGTEDMQLQSEDLIRPVTVNESQMLAYVVRTYLDKLAYDQSRMRNPLDVQQEILQLPVAANANVAAVVAKPVQANAVSASNPFGLLPGQLENYSSGQEDFSSVPADIQRANIIALLDVAAPGSPLAQQHEMAYQKALAGGADSSAVSQGPGQVTQAQQAALMAARGGAISDLSGMAGLQPGLGQDMGGLTGTASGANGQPYSTGGAASAVPLAPNYQDQPAAPGSFASNQEVQTFGELSRQLGMDPLVLINFLIDHRARLDGAVRGPGPYFVGPNVSLADLVQAAGGTLSWADESGVELLTTVVDSRNGRAVSQRQTLPLRQGTLAAYVVRPKDQLHFNRVFTDTGIGSVSVQGEVRFAGNYPITRGEHLSDLLMRVGGLNGTAYPAGTVFLRKSSARIEEQGYKRTANEIQSQLLAGMARIGSDKISGEGFTAIQGFITQLRNQKGLGRIAIAADP
ncbi:MAG: SLBB domain-containing protein, partial [Rhizomicrobium sp.]